MAGKLRTLRKFDDLLEQAKQFATTDPADPAFSQWRLTVSALLEAYFGRDHDFVARFRELLFRDSFAHASFDHQNEWVSPFIPTADDHARAFQQHLQKAKVILGAARDVWHDRPTKATDNAPLVNITNQNNSNAVARSNASVTVEFPLAELMHLVHQTDGLTPEQQRQATEYLEDMDGELRKARPRWEKLVPGLKFMLDAGKDLAIQTMSAVAANMITGQ